MRVMITGANGHIGQQLIRRLHGQHDVVAVVRSERAADTVRSIAADMSASIDVRVVDYNSTTEIAIVGEECDAIIHLVGIIKESAGNSFVDAHQGPCQALCEAGLDGRIVYLGIAGSATDSENECLRSRAWAERLLMASRSPLTILRVPMVIGPEDYASHSLAKSARSKVATTFRASSREQPIYSEDVVDALIAAMKIEEGDQILTLGGPENLSRRELIHRAAKCLDGDPVVLSIPISIGYFFVGLIEHFTDSPPASRAMLGVLDHDDNIDNTEALACLGINLTPLDKMLEATLPLQAL